MAIPKYQIPQDGAPGDTVYAMIKDELDLDGRPTLNLARYRNHIPMPQGLADGRQLRQHIH